jgi:hypothetical protein
MSGWDKAREVADQYDGGGGDFRSLQDHDHYVVGIPMGEPHPREQHWDQDEYTSKPCTGDETCKNCKAGLPKSVKFWINLFTWKAGTGTSIDEQPHKIEILNLSRQAFQSLITVFDKYGLDKFAFEFRRNGAKGSKKTKYSVLPDKMIDELPGDVLTAFRALTDEDLVDLEELADRLDGNTPSGGGGGGNDGGSRNGGARGGGSDTISADEVADFTVDLKKLGKVKAKEILAELGVARLTLVQKSQVADLRRLIEEADDDDSFV